MLTTESHPKEAIGLLTESMVGVLLIRQAILEGSECFDIVRSLRVIAEPCDSGCPVAEQDPSEQSFFQ